MHGQRHSTDQKLVLPPSPGHRHTRPACCHSAYSCLAWNTNPTAQSQPKWDSAETKALAQRACFDCHSNQTTWPWYSYIAPGSWLIARDVIAGRRALNFDDWQTSLARADRFPLDQQVQREISRGDMPPSYFLWLHPDAKLTAAEQQQLIDGLAKTIQAK